MRDKHMGSKCEPERGFLKTLDLIFSSTPLSTLSHIHASMKGLEKDEWKGMLWNY